jgi:hydroxymethylglutaryl-CoA lyase
VLTLPAKATVVEVGPRDGLQSFPRPVDTQTKIRMIDRLSEAGFPVIEVTGFAHPRVIPNLADAEAVFAGIRRRPGIVYRGLVPNARGAERARKAGVDEMLGLVTVSERYLTKNQNMDMDTAVAQNVESFRIAEAAGIAFTMALGMALWCPYEGLIPVERTLDVLGRFHEAGIRRFYFAGSVGMEDPAHVNRLFTAARARHPDAELGWHVHNVAGFGAANVVAALDGGATRIEGSICGVGGGIAMPGAMGTVGNLPTEDVVHLLNEMGVVTGIATEAAIAASRDVAALLGIEARSHVAHGGTRRDILARGRQSPAAHPV